MAGIWKLLRNKWYPPADPTTPFTGQTMLITGANTGIGYEAAIKFANLGVKRIVLGVRNLDAGERAQRTIQHLATHQDARVEVWHLDLFSYESIRGFVKRAETELETLDVAVLNAGAINLEFKKSEYGWERMLQVNTLSTVLLAILLLPKLKNSKRENFTPTLELVSSGLHYVATLPDQCSSEDTKILEEMNKEENFIDGHKQYGRTKLLTHLALDGLKKLAEPKGLAEDSASKESNNSTQPDVWIISVCPGACSSNLAREYTQLPFRIAKAIFSMLLRTQEEGSRTLVSGAALGEKGHGEFWQHDIIKEPAPILVGEDGQMLKGRLWNEIIDALRKDVPDLLEKMR